MTKEIDIVRPFVITPAAKAVAVAGSWVMLTPITVLIVASLVALSVVILTNTATADPGNWLSMTWFLVKIAAAILSFVGGCAAGVVGFFLGTTIQQKWLRWSANFNEKQYVKQRDRERERAKEEVLDPVPAPMSKAYSKDRAWTREGGYRG